MKLKASLDHIGIAVADLPGFEGLRKLFSLLGINVTDSENVPDQGVRTHFLPLSAPASGSRLEFLEVTDPQGTVAKFIEKRGPGIHHLSFLVQSGRLDALCQKLKSEGFRLIYEQPRAGAHGMRINFIHPSSAGGLLIEVMESGEKSG